MWLHLLGQRAHTIGNIRHPVLSFPAFYNLCSKIHFNLFFEWYYYFKHINALVRSEMVIRVLIIRELIIVSKRGPALIGYWYLKGLEAFNIVSLTPLVAVIHLMRIKIQNGEINWMIDILTSIMASPNGFIISHGIYISHMNAIYL